MYVSLSRETSKWSVKRFEENHNHLLHIPETVHMMKSNRKILEAQAISIEIAADCGLSLKESHNLLSAQVGGTEWLGFTMEDHKTHLRTRRQRSLKYGESGALLGYFKKQAAENPYFYYAVQVDVDEKITNIFWADHEMITDYGLFGDAISFDTTFRTNKEDRPFALFAGFNHFRMTSIFGAALLYDETTESFVWLFKTFLHAMSGKKPTTIFTDQDAAMAKAISIVMPNISHGLCTFHLNQNALKHLGHLYKCDDSNFGNELNTCIFGYKDENELRAAWISLIKKYKLEDNLWMNKTWELREKWAHAYLKWSFTAGMRSTQLSESLNAKIKKCLKSDLNIVQFFTQFDTVIVEKRYEEFKAIYNSREKLPRLVLKESPLLIQVAQLYTPPLFDLFHGGLDTSLRCKVKRCHESEGQFSCVITMYKKDVEYLVEGSFEIDEFGDNICRDVCCTCRKFESFGILCCHAIKGLDRVGIMEIPESYILGRW
ncbi:protein FAR1-RELATED SEQUENCE 5-like [Rhododendron vialii]|uniref:protein FAR1-RELATED SEQUENCE 5-like n=1 Tax=Rhododendron vialii TaxID=182163 RepID=UPI00265E4ADD|nr:protein FAR1-RELATED SEQUENCE 5-like [Rhododendron vialii]